MPPVRLGRSFYETDALTLAMFCLGKLLVLETPAGVLCGIICETEAYMGVTDRASHAYGGRRTARNEIMYHRPGLAYVYRIYGLYHCLNFTAREEGNPEAVLIRSVVPAEGIRLMAENRTRNGRAKAYPAPETMTAKQRRSMTEGPGRLCTAFGITTEHNGADLTAGGLYLADAGISVPPYRCMPRVGIDYAGEDRDRPWRFLADPAGIPETIG